MDFFEKIFGVDPDGGNGSLEFIFLVGIAAVVVLVAFYVMRKRAERTNR